MRKDKFSKDTCKRNAVERPRFIDPRSIEKRTKGNKNWYADVYVAAAQLQQTIKRTNPFGSHSEFICSLKRAIWQVSN